MLQKDKATLKAPRSQASRDLTHLQDSFYTFFSLEQDEGRGKNQESDQVGGKKYIKIFENHLLGTMLPELSSWHVQGS
jgi:hypothetical protein